MIIDLDVGGTLTDVVLRDHTGLAEHLPQSRLVSP
jgi:N-methylhydantoinase A/oxoprolinase/acetone carboxylase beta subunit